MTKIEEIDFAGLVFFLSRNDWPIYIIFVSNLNKFMLNKTDIEMKILLNKYKKSVFFL